MNIPNGYESCGFNEAEGFMADRLYLINTFECERSFGREDKDRGVWFRRLGSMGNNREEFVPYPMFSVCQITPVRKAKVRKFSPTPVKREYQLGDLGMGPNPMID